MRVWCGGSGDWFGAPIIWRGGGLVWFGAQADWCGDDYSQLPAIQKKFNKRKKPS
ncbi:MULTISPECIES: hypothetical protein [Sporosarcina]|uniref:Uncharacterized protein n=1 Tax=Sporosarcina newyorkensis 2681 TaxID=1027292 RepID=F9DQB0_9BACL|nr:MULTISPECIES: hypothetical protein [Sporosarcina]EGQ26960.1 hypothetical protein HMPREF9372_0990 [Sporosarcina newyorkensis 2681]MBY0223511.1 hypothetical protein [Sporosarcina aquimarina]